MIFWFGRRTASNLTLRGRKILDELEELLPRMENLVEPALFDPKREKSHFRISQARITFVQSCFRLCAGSTRPGATKSTLNSGPGGSAASQNSWSTGSLILFSTLMTGSCRRIFSRRGSTRRIGFAPWRATATLATGCHSSNTLPRATSWLPPMRGCKQFRTNNWRLSAQHAALVFGCLTSAWRCNAFPARN